MKAHLMIVALSVALAAGSAWAKEPAQKSTASAPVKCTGLNAGEVAALQRAGKMKYGPFGKGQGYGGTGYSSSQLAGAYYTNTAPDGGTTCK
jgi:hypothetical protein